jgi:hypothetical protein
MSGFVEKTLSKLVSMKWAQPGHFSRTLAKGPKQLLDLNYMQMLMILIAKLVL